MSRKRTPKSVKASCDRVWSRVVKGYAGWTCERCGRVDGLEAHHAWGRTDHRLRFEPRNGVCLCHACHRWAESFPLEFAWWFGKHRPADVEFLSGERLKGLIKRTLADYLELEAGLLLLLDDFEEAA